MLRGARLVSATETEEGKRWNEALIKRITGGERIAARLMRQDFTEFVPEMKLVITGNHRPALRTVDEAIRRRIRLVPFVVTIPIDQRDKRLPEKLKREWPGILAWLIEGAVSWVKASLPACSAIDRATEEYLSAEDLLQRWIDERCVRDGEATTTTGELFTDWKRWCAASEEYPGTMRRFSQRLQERGFARWQHPVSRRAGYRGLALVSQATQSDGDT
jgi:putative DNA primase/helicase